MRFSLVFLGLLAASPLHAQNIDAGTASFRLGALRGDENLNALRATTEMFWEMGFIDLQLGGAIEQMGDDPSDGDFRLIASHSFSPNFRFGLSASVVSDDKIRTHVGVYGLNFLYESPYQYLEGEFLIPDHINTTGAFSFDINAEQWVTSDLSITTHLYRLSTDPENPDMYSIAVGATYAVNDAVTLIGEGFQTRADDYHFNNNGGRLGVAYQVSPHVAVTAALMHVVPEDGESSSGVTILAEFDFGETGERARIFRSEPYPDRFGLAAF